MSPNEITREMAYLCIGEEINKVNTEQILYSNFRGIKYFIIGKEKVIKGESGIFCSCNQNYCWHIFKLVFDEAQALKKQ
jgi:hypothetical protein